MVHLSDYQFKTDKQAIDRLNKREVDLHTPLHLGGYFAVFSPYTAPKFTGYYTFYWFADNKSKTIKNALYISPNNY